MKQGELTLSQIAALAAFGTAMFFAMRWAGVKGWQPNQPTTLSPREQHIRELSDRFGIPIEDVRAAHNRLDGHVPDYRE